jgi:hypothetical protein
MTLKIDLYLLNPSVTMKEAVVGYNVARTGTRNAYGILVRKSL